MKRSRGFTLIEMLIVIAVIGVLAVAVLSAINPVEQMRKARDTRRRSNAAELLNAVERYYSTTEVNPPALVSGAGAPATCADALAAGNVDAADLADLDTTNELKSEFITRVTGSSADWLYAGIDSSSDLAVVCYQIESQANITKYTGAANHCTAGAPALDYVCLPE